VRPRVQIPSKQRGQGVRQNKRWMLFYSLIEMLKYYYNTDWDGMADSLGVSHKSVDRIKMLANKKELHLRHTTAADPEGVDQADLDKAVAAAKAILLAFISHEYAAETAKTPPP
jgi:hypothetical protein